MGTSKKGKPTELLGLHKGQRFTEVMDALPRRALNYKPRAESSVNVERLPSPVDLESMELAYREEPIPESELLENVDRQLAVGMVLTSLGSLAFVTVLPIIPWQLVFAAAGLFSVLGVVGKYRGSVLSSVQLVRAAIKPIVIAVALKASSILVVRPMLLAGVLGIVTFMVIAEKSSKPFRFYRKWLYTAPRLKPSTRRQKRNPMPQPSVLVLAGLLAVAVLVPWLGNWIAILGVAALALFWIGGRSAKLSWQQTKGELGGLRQALRRVFAQYLNYGEYSSEAAGVWQPGGWIQGRRMTAILLVSLPTLTLTIALAGFVPWDMPVLSGAFHRVCKEHIANGPPFLELVSSLAPEAQWQDLPEPMTDYYLQELPERLAVRIRARTEDEYQQKYALALSEYQRTETEKREKQYQEKTRPIFQGLLEQKPFMPVLVAIVGVIHGEPIFILVLAAAIVFAGVLPVLVLIATWVPLLKDAAREEGVVMNLDKDDRPEWQWYVDRIRSSEQSAASPLGGPLIQERDHLFMGVEPVADFPVLLDREILSEHAYLVGDSGSGKTSLGLMPLLVQLLRGDTSGEELSEEAAAKLSPSPPMVILDLKGDIALFNLVRQEVERRNPNKRDAFLFFTPEQGRSSCFFNPFQSLVTENRSILQLCQLLLDSLGLNHGEGYGRSYYSRKSRHKLFEVMRREPQPQSIEELYARLQGSHDDVFELMATVEALAQYPQLATREPPRSEDRVIHMPTVLEKSQVVYFWLPSALESVSVREIGKLALFGLLTAAIDRQRAGLPKQQAYLVIDEFQRIASENFKIILEQARSFGLSAILANQTRSDLKLHDVDLRTTVNTNTRYKQFFSVTDPGELDELMQLSGEEVGALRSTGTSSTDWSRTVTDFIKPRLSTNDILKISDHPLDSVIHVSRGRGYTQFGGACVHLRSIWPLHRKNYEELSEQTWPDVEPAEDTGVVVSEQSPVEVDEIGKETMRRRREVALKRLYEENLPKELDD